MTERFCVQIVYIAKLASYGAIFFQWLQHKVIRVTD